MTLAWTLSGLLGSFITLIVLDKEYRKHKEQKTARRYEFESRRRRWKKKNK